MSLSISVIYDHPKPGEIRGDEIPVLRLTIDGIEDFEHEICLGELAEALKPFLMDKNK